MKKIYFIVVHLLFFNTTFSQVKLDVFDVSRNGNLKQMKEIFENNPKAIFLTNENGFSPLILACYHNNYETAKFLLEHHSNVNTSSPMGTSLMAAVVKGNIQITQLLLKNKADVNSADSNGTTALIFAIMFKSIVLVKLLLFYNADKTKIDNKGKTAFEYAVFLGDEKIINLLK
ncbi:ankyrin repeat domain-containing protein [Flavobacterium sp. 83]|uniref:ankyrin repeat domain-containing protein n=1 Tax=Flavobacterium sp. 83 TaxID=1131812 RepID=UPI000557620F|nr:ankyrin repeat domain-containing protein [Flavobacterium sp. 83]